MARRQQSSLAVCPYYLGHIGSVIHCEGPLGNTAIHLAFSSHSQMEEYMRTYCNATYERCMIGEQLERKYHRKHKKGRGL